MKETTNRPIPEIYKSLYEEKVKGESLFLIVGDLNLKGKYGESLLCFTKDKFFAFDECFPNRFITIDYKEKINDDQFGYRFAAGVMVPLCGGLAESVRAEVEYGLLNKTHNVVARNTVQSQLQTAFANFYYDLDTGTSVTPYVGVGVGYARIAENTNGAESNEDNFAYNVGAGVSVNLTYNMDVEVGYRFTDYGKIKDRTPEYSKRNYDSQEVLLGLGYTF